MEKSELLVKRNLSAMYIIKHMNNNSDHKVACLTCTKTYCCQNTEEFHIFSEEIDVLSSLITEQHRKNAVQSLEDKLKTGKYSCPFLEEDGCSIYEHRPLVCSSYAVVAETPEGCNDPNTYTHYIEQKDIYGHMPKDLFNKTYTDRVSTILQLFMKEPIITDLSNTGAIGYSSSTLC